MSQRERPSFYEPGEGPTEETIDIVRPGLPLNVICWLGERLERRARLSFSGLLQRTADLAWERLPWAERLYRAGGGEPSTPVRERSLDAMTADGHAFDWRMQCAVCGRTAKQIALDRLSCRPGPPPTPMPGPGRTVLQ